MKTTAKHFKIFKKEIEKWIPILGVTDWRTTVLHLEDEDGDSRAWYSPSPGTRVCAFILAKDWGDDVITINRIKRSAFHEVMHLAMNDTFDMLFNRGYTDTEVSVALHKIIFPIENYIFGNE